MTQSPTDSNDFSNVVPNSDPSNPRGQGNEGHAENTNAGLKELESVSAISGAHGQPRLEDVYIADEQDLPERFDRAWWMRLGGYSALAVLSFSVFLYFSFPFAVLKETIVSTVSEQMRAAGLEVRLNMGAMRLDWITGIVMKDVTLTNLRDSKAQLKFEEVKARVRLLPLFMGRFGASLDVLQGKGTISASVSLPISGLMSGAVSLSEANLDFRNFAVDGFVTQGMGLLKGSTNPAMALILPLISVTTAGGNLNGKINFDGSELSSLDRMKGKVGLDVKGMYLHIADNVWQIPKQEFTTARIDASVEAGSIVLGPTTQFVAPDIDIALGGKLAPMNEGFDAALTLKIAMRRRVQQNIGNLVPAVLKCLQPLKENTLPDGEKEMVLEAKLSGPLIGMACEQF
jgi:type II secretion system protein N